LSTSSTRVWTWISQKKKGVEDPVVLKTARARSTAAEIAWPASAVAKLVEAEPSLYYPDVLFINEGVDNNPIFDDEPTV
jgi:hypothetical protein